jgi:hypothetical protein
MRMIKYILILILISFSVSSCHKESKADNLADTFCDCAQPIVEWSKGLDYHYEKLKEGTEVKKKVADCLAGEKEKYADKKDDMEFQKEVAAKVNEQCPEANTAVQAMFIMLFKE